ncbi:MAG: hypothetical protein AB1508_15955 [Pseudomonadota bacterium]
MKLHLYLRGLAILMAPVALLMSLPAGAQGVQPTSQQPVSAQLMPKAPDLRTTAQPTPAKHAALDAWRKAILKIPRPKKDACFEAAYPATAWHKVACKAPLDKLYLPKHPGTVGAETVGGNGPEFSAQVTGAITLAEGSFVSVTPITSECSVPCNSSTDVCPTNPSCTTTSGAVADDYSLQINTAPFSTKTCSGSPASTSPPCLGWEQFVFPASGGGSIQYWLLNYGPANTQCPAPRGASCMPGHVSNDGWCPFQFSPTGNVYCVVNSKMATSAPGVPPTSPEFPTMTLSGQAGSGTTNDSITVIVAGIAHTRDGGNYFPDLGTGTNWQEAEFNVVGDGNASQAVFNAGSTIVVRNAVTSAIATTSAPTCYPGGFTGESNSLNISPAQGTKTPPICCSYGGASPAIEFVESNNSTEWAKCGNPITWGDPHITTVNGTYYNFQGAGEYIALLDPDGTEVQVRQTPIPSDAPANWVPPAPANYQNDGLVSCLSGNTAVAARVGTHRATYEPGPSGLQLRIDGEVTTTGEKFSDGGSVETSSDGIEILFPDGKILTVSGSLPQLSVEFAGLGAVGSSTEAPESGLAGNVPTGSWLPRLPNGAAVGPMPAALHDRYVTLNQTFGNAWRVSNGNSLFDYEPGTSTATFTNAAWPAENAKTCSVQNVRTTPHISAGAAEEVCKLIKNTFLHSSCVFDVQTTGITHLADIYAVTERVHTKLAVKPITK